MNPANAKTRIAIACGGSGGHIFPAIALAQSLYGKSDDIDILFIGSNKNLDKRIFEKERFRFTLLSGNALPYKMSFKIVPFGIRFAFDVIKSLYILLSYRPHAVIGFGGYVSSPVIFVAYILRIPRIVHEQNVVPGRANAFLFKFADKVAISFEETKKFLGPSAMKTVHTGNPIRTSLLKDDRADGIRKFGLDINKFTILVVGGSQGAHRLNENFIKALSKIDDSIKASLQVIHITGVADYAWAVETYKGLGLEHRVYSFIDRIEEAYSASNLIVTRSGASAIFEIAFFGRPMILVPYPFAMSHQAENAKVFSSSGAALHIDEKDLSPELFRDKIMQLLNDRTRLLGMAASAKRLSVPCSSDNLAAEVLGVVKR